MAGQAIAAGPLQTAIVDPTALNGSGSPTNTDLAFARTRAAGAQVVRLVVSWRAIAPREPANPTNPADPAYRWNAVDRLVRLSAAHRLDPILNIDSAPAWAEGKIQGANRPDRVNPRFRGPFRPNPVAFGRFARAAALRYSGSYGGLPRVRYWMAWNEPNVSAFLTPQLIGGKTVSPTVYRGLLNSFADAVHAVRASNVVIAGGLSPFTVKNPISVAIGPLRFMRELLCMSKGARPRPTCRQQARFDVWAHHPYTSGGPTRQAFYADDASLGDLPEMRKVLLAAVRARRIVSRQKMRFWVTEFSWDSKPPDPHPRALPMRLHARWVSEALYRMWRSGVSLVTWFLLRDEPYPASPYQSGLYFRGGQDLLRDQPKPSLTAFRFPFVALRERGGLTVWGRTPDSRPATVLVEQSAGGSWRRLAQLRADRHGIFTRRLSLASVSARRTSARPRARPSARPLVSYRDRVLADSPTSYWRLGEAGGTAARDERGARSGLYRGGVKQGVAGALVRERNGAISLDGRDDRVDLGPLSSPKTVELWLKTSAVRAGAAFSNRNAINHYVFVGPVTSGNPLAFDSLSLLGTRWVSDNQWHHIVYTYQGVLGRLYVDGVVDGMASWERLEGTSDASLGYDASLKAHLKGSLDEVAIYDYALTPAQVKAHFDASGRKPTSSGQFQQIGKGVHLRARLASGTALSLPFALAAPPDRYVLPFGGGGG